MFRCRNEDDWSKISKRAIESIKTFDDLFNDNKNDDNSGKKAKNSAADNKKENDDGKKSANGDLNFETSKHSDSE